MAISSARLYEMDRSPRRPGVALKLDSGLTAFPKATATPYVLENGSTVDLACNARSGLEQLYREGAAWLGPEPLK